MKQKLFRMQLKKRTGQLLQSSRGVALIYALVVMAVVTALALALLYGVGAVSLMTGSYSDQDDCYVQALTLSRVIEKQLTTASGGGIYDAAVAYMPDSDSETTGESELFTAQGLTDAYGTTRIRFQNGVDQINESKNWERKQLGCQYLDVTVEVFGEKNGKESVTTRYRFYRELDDDDMEYTLTTNQYTGSDVSYACEYRSDTDCFYVYDAATNEIIEEQLTINGETVTMEMAEKFAGVMQKCGVKSIEITDADGNTQSMSVEVELQLTRKRRILGFEGDAVGEYKGTELKFEKMYTK